MVFLRHVKVTLWRAKDINACAGFFKSRTIVTATASYKNLVYSTSPVQDMGKNPEWEEDGTSVFHFEFRDDPNEFITLELFNRTKSLIGVSKLSFSALQHLLPGKSETMTLPVMVPPNRQFGELIFKAEILEQQAMGDQGLLVVKIQKGHMIKKITSILAKTTAIKAKVTYKHTTLTSGVLEGVGNRFIWHGDNVFTFIINTDVEPDHDTLKIEVYNVRTKVGECEMRMSSFFEENLRGLSNEFATHTAQLSPPNRSGIVGNIEVGTNFIPNPGLLTRRNSSPRYSPYVHGSEPPVNQSVPQEYTPSAPVMHGPYDRVGSRRASTPPGYQQPADGAVGAPAGPSRDYDSELELSRFKAAFH